jgi:hypothetical protein
MKKLHNALATLAGQIKPFSLHWTSHLASGIWLMLLEEKSEPLTAFTIPRKRQYQWITSPMGLLGCPASFQCLLEGVLRNI